MALSDEDKKYLDEYEQMAQPKAMTNDDMIAQALMAIAPTLVGAAIQGYKGGAIGAGAGLKGLETMENSRKADAENRSKFALKRMDLMRDKQKLEESKKWDLYLAGYKNSMTAEEKAKDRNFQNEKLDKVQTYQDAKLGKTQTFENEKLGKTQGFTKEQAEAARAFQKDQADKERALREKLAKMAGTRQQNSMAQFKTDAQTTKLADTLDKTGLVELSKSMNDIDASLRGMGFSKGVYSDVNEEKIDIPGWGKASVAEKLLPFKTGRLLMSEKGQEFRQLVDSVKNAIYKARAGGAVTPGEEARLIGEIEGANDDAGIMQGLRMASDTINDRIQNIKSGTNPAALNQYYDRGGEIKMIPKENTSKKGPSVDQKKAYLDALIKKKEAEAAKKRGR